MAGETPLGDWTSALQKAQSDLMRQWLDMNAAWARATSPQAAANAAATGAAAGCRSWPRSAAAAIRAAGALPVRRCRAAT